MASSELTIDGSVADYCVEPVTPGGRPGSDPGSPDEPGDDGAAPDDPTEGVQQPSEPVCTRFAYAPRYTDDLEPGRGPDGDDDVGRIGIRTRPDGVIERKYRISCEGQSPYDVWIADSEPVDPDDPNSQPLPDPEVLARMLYVELSGTIPAPTIRIAPAETDDNGYAYVQVPAYFWVDEWAPISNSISGGSVTVSVSIEPVRLDIDLGNGETISCTSAPAFGAGDDIETFDGCGYTYKHSSAMAPNGETWTVGASLVWHGTWSSNIGVGGDMGELATSSTRELPVAEIQAIVTDTGSD